MWIAMLILICLIVLNQKILILFISKILKFLQGGSMEKKFKKWSLLDSKNVNAKLIKNSNHELKDIPRENRFIFVKVISILKQYTPIK